MPVTTFAKFDLKTLSKSHIVKCAFLGVAAMFTMGQGCPATFSGRTRSSDGLVRIQTIHSFGCTLTQAPLVQTVDGLLYGTTYSGGLHGYGQIFRADTNGSFASLYSFTGGADGAIPMGGLTLASDNTLYGVTTGGGALGYGSIFRVTTNGVVTTLYSFTNGVDGSTPYGRLLFANPSTLYGTAFFGGSNQFGTVFRLTTGGVFTALYSFTGGSDGNNPYAGLTLAGDGNFYGTTESAGNIFRMTPEGEVTNLYTLTSLDGGSLYAGLVEAPDGQLYGVANFGGANSDFGTVFRITTNGAFTKLFDFSNDANSALPISGLTLAWDGNLYGTTAGSPSGNGTIFRIGTNTPLQTIYTFLGPEGSTPASALLQGADGKLYGTTYTNALNGAGGIFSVTTSGDVTNVYSFAGDYDGAQPAGGLTSGGDGYLYGATAGSLTAAGTIFRMDATGVISSVGLFNLANDSLPGGAPSLGNDGNFYGVFTAGFGGVYRWAKNGSIALVYAFSGSDGSAPNGKLLLASDGWFYGATQTGGASGLGTLFKVDAAGDFSSLYSFSGPDGSTPYGNLIQGRDGVIYGTTLVGGVSSNGTIFSLTTNGTFKTLYYFTGGADGANIYAGLLQASDGYLYGASSSDTNGGNGGVFRISTKGDFAVIYTFTNGVDGGSPQGGLMQATDGNLYGTTTLGPLGGGTIYRITTNGGFMPLAAITGGVSGASPAAPLVQLGNYLYGTMPSQGAQMCGTVFAVNLVGPPAETLSIERDGGKVVVKWDGPVSAFALQGARTVAGAYTNVSGATSPYTNNAAASNGFFRLIGQ